MPIPESQLDTWSNIGALTSSATAYASIKTALEASTSPIRSLDYEVYLQGSYRNKTNIYGDSDVDVVVQLNKTFGRDLSALPNDQRQVYERSYDNATYLWPEYRRDVIRALENYYDSSRVHPGNKAIKVQVGQGRITADVVPALQYRRYISFHSINNQRYVEGIKLYDSSGNQIVNYPKLHIANGETKNSQDQTNGWYKPTVRIFKNAKAYLVDHGRLNASQVPSYFLECALYNAPHSTFGGTYRQTVERVTAFLSEHPFDRFMCQNGRILLFGNGQVHWNTDDFAAFREAFAVLWDNWR